MSGTPELFYCADDISYREGKEMERLLATSDFAILAETFLIPGDEYNGNLLVVSLRHLGAGTATYEDAYWAMFGASDTLGRFSELQYHILLLASRKFVRLLRKAFSEAEKGEGSTENIFGTELWKIRGRINDAFWINSVSHPSTVPMRLVHKKLKGILYSIYEELITAASSREELEGFKQHLLHAFGCKSHAYKTWYEKAVNPNLPEYRQW